LHTTIPTLRMPHIEQELRRYFKGVRFLRSVSEKFYPGKIIHPEKEQVVFHIRDYLRSLPAEKWHLDKTVSHNLIYGKKISGAFTLHLPSSLLGVMTLHPVPGKTAGIELEYEISEIFATEFTNTSPLELRYELNKLRYINKALFRELKSRMLITEAYYARSFLLHLKKTRNGNPFFFDEEFVQIDPIVQHIVSNESITVMVNENFPFAVSGILIK
jgi:hypothetical protein